MLNHVKPLVLLVRYPKKIAGRHGFPISRFSETLALAVVVSGNRSGVRAVSGWAAATELRPVTMVL